MKYRDLSAMKNIDIKDVLTCLNLDEEDRVLPLYDPDKYCILFYSKAKVFSIFFINGNRDLLKNGAFKYMIRSSYVHPAKLTKICEQFKINYLFYNRAYLDCAANKYGIVYDLSKFEKIYQDKNYIVYQLLPAKAGSLGNACKAGPRVNPLEL